MVRPLPALLWNYGGSFAKALSQVVLGVVMVRLLGPEPFGLIALAWAVISFTRMADPCLALALVQRRVIDGLDERFVATAQISAGLLMTVAMLIVAPWFTIFFAKPDLLPVLYAMSAMPLFIALGQTATALLERSLDFRHIQIATVTSYLVGYLIVGLPMAMMGAGVWSLVSAFLTQAGLCSLMVFLFRPHSLYPRLKSDAAWDLGHFGFKALIGNLACYTISAADTWFMGYHYGQGDLGRYNRAGALVHMPSSNLFPSLQNVLLPVFSYQGEVLLRQRAFLAACAGVGLIAIPAGILLATCAECVVLAVFGPGWEPAVVVVVPLALTLPLMAVVSVSCPLIQGVGKIGHETLVHVIMAVVLVAALFVTSRWSIEAVAWTVLVVAAIRATWLLVIAMPGAVISIDLIIRALLPGMMLTVVCVPVALLADRGLAAIGAGPLTRLGAVVAGVLLAMMGFYRLRPRLLLGPYLLAVLPNGQPPKLADLPHLMRSVGEESRIHRASGSGVV
jgi:PST family polysaccharide transporter